MEVKAKSKYIKTAPRKVRLVIDCVRGMGVDNALNQLKFINKKVTRDIEKLINSAISNAVNNFELERNNLFVKEIKADDGPTLKRWMPRARGRATTIRKRTTHVEVILGELVDSGKKEGKKQKVADPIKLDGKSAEDKDVKKETKKSSVKKGETAKTSVAKEEKGKKIVDPRGEGKGKNTKIEGGQKTFVNKIFRRKSG